MSFFHLFLQDKAASLVIRVLSAFKASEIKKAIDDLDQPTLDILMKYIYRGFESPKEASQANLLQWHEKVCKKRFCSYFSLTVGGIRFCVEQGDSASGALANSFEATSTQID